MARGVSLLLILSLVVSAYAHTYLSSISVDGVAFGEGDCVRAHPIGTANFPIPLVSAADMTCGFLPLGAQPANRKCPVQAGSKIAIQWNYASAAPGDIHLDSSHKGPTMVYMAKSETGAGSVWFKVFERGLVNPSSNPQVWGTDEMIANKGKVEFTIPTDLAPGNYLIRGEVIALHGAYDLNGAQPYVGCAEVTVSGSGNAYPDTVALPGAYKNTDPGIYVSIYNGLTSYVIPGPRPYVVGTATNPAPPAAASSSASASSSSASSSSASSSGSSATSSSTVPSTAGLSVYSDSLSTLFADYSWASQRNPQDSSYAYKGSFSYSFTPKAWEAVFFYCQNCIDTAKFERIEFWVNGGATGGQNVNFNLIEGSSFVQPDVSIATYTGGAIPANRWVKGTMQLSSFAAGTYDGIWFQDRSGSTQGTLYIDEIVLVPRSSSQKGNDALDQSDLEHPVVDTHTKSSSSSAPFSKLILSNIVTFVGTLVVVGVVVASVYIYKKRKSSSQYQYNEFVENGRL